MEIRTTENYMAENAEENGEVAQVKSNESRVNRTNVGLKWVAAGAILGFLSCVCSICNPVESLYFVNLYGVSSVAVLIAFYGLYQIFE